jgi:hypothetical protein
MKEKHQHHQPTLSTDTEIHSFDPILFPPHRAAHRTTVSFFSLLRKDVRNF